MFKLLRENFSNFRAVVTFPIELSQDQVNSIEFSLSTSYNSFTHPSGYFDIKTTVN